MNVYPTALAEQSNPGSITLGEPLPITFGVDSNDIVASPRNGANTDLVSTFDRILRSSDQNILTVSIPDGLDFDVDRGEQAQLEFRITVTAGTDISANDLAFSAQGFRSVRQTGGVGTAGQDVTIGTGGQFRFGADTNVGQLAARIATHLRAGLNSFEDGTPWEVVDGETFALVNGVQSTEAFAAGNTLANTTTFVLTVQSENRVTQLGTGFGGTVLLTHAATTTTSEQVNVDAAGRADTGPLTVEFVYQPDNEANPLAPITVATFDTTQENIDSAALRGRISAHGSTTAGLTVNAPIGTNIQFVLDNPRTFTSGEVRTVFNGVTTTYTGVVTALDEYVTPHHASS